MTLQQFFESVSQNPGYLIWFLCALPLITLVIGLWISDLQQAYKLRSLYAILAWLACVPGIFAVTLNIYLFLFERQSIWQMNLITQVLPVVSMFFTLYFIKRQLPFEHVPGFEKLLGFVTLMAAVMGIMWFVDRTRIMVFSYMPFQYIIIGFIVLLLMIRFGLKKMF
jgi:hypothetical protein